MGPPQMNGNAPWMRAMQERDRSTGRPSGMRGGPPWMQKTRPSGMEYGPPWMREQGRRHAPDGQAERVHEGQQSNGQHRDGPDGARRGRGEGPERDGPDGARRGRGEGPER
ncbi:hypothetical protein N9B17_04110, partial [Rhodopirellula sp.]|nr:hypothetical protein [Rhodopirellula sp.]